MQYPGSLFLIAGLRTGTGGARSSSVYKSQAGLLCDMNGVACSYRYIAIYIIYLCAIPYHCACLCVCPYKHIYVYSRTILFRYLRIYMLLYLYIEVNAALALLAVYAQVLI